MESDTTSVRYCLSDIGTSVLYTVMEITREIILLKHHHLGHEQAAALVLVSGDLLTRSEILGGLSLVIWVLIFFTVKYDLIIMRADHRGEGGTFALWSLLQGYTGKIPAGSLVSFLVICAAVLLAVDGIITPPISMLGPFEPLGQTVSVIVTLVCFVFLFKMLSRRTITGLLDCFSVEKGKYDTTSLTLLEHFYCDDVLLPRASIGYHVMQIAWFCFRQQASSPVAILKSVCHPSQLLPPVP